MLLYLLFLAAPPARGVPAGANDGLCDIFEAGSTQCVAAHSLGRALFSRYAGPLYRVRRLDDGATLRVEVQHAGGLANITVQESFCTGSLCVIDVIYDQTDFGNHLGIEHGFSYLTPPRNSQDAGVNVSHSRAKIAIGSSEVYSAVFDTHCDVHTGGNCSGKFSGYSNRTAVHTAVGDEPQTVYALLDGKHYNSGCCLYAVPSSFTTVSLSIADCLTLLCVTVTMAMPRSSTAAWVQATWRLCTSAVAMLHLPVMVACPRAFRATPKANPTCMPISSGCTQ